MAINRNAADDRAVATDTGEVIDTRDRIYDMSVGTRIEIVGKHRSMTNEHIIRNRHTTADKGMAFDLAAPTDRYTAGDLHERTDEGLIPDLATEDVDQIAIEDMNVLAER